MTDHLGSVRLVVDTTSNAVVQALTYDPWGVVVQDTNPGFQPFGYAGGLYDHRTGLVRFGVRDYDATIGRWLAKDPVRFVGGDANLYAYVFSEPLMLTDPPGLWGIGWGDTSGNVQWSIGWGEPTLLFTPDTAGDLVEGAAATADGFIPFADPFQNVYDVCDPSLAASRALGALSRDVLFTAAGLRSAAALGGSRIGHVLNHNRYLRIGPGRMPPAGNLPGGSKVPRISVGGRPNGPHFDLRVGTFF